MVGPPLSLPWMTAMPPLHVSTFVLLYPVLNMAARLIHFNCTQTMSLLLSTLPWLPIPFTVKAKVLIMVHETVLDLAFHCAFFYCFPSCIPPQPHLSRCSLKMPSTLLLYRVFVQTLSPFWNSLLHPRSISSFSSPLKWYLI